MIRAVYPGTFDPVTFGHLDVIRRASRIYDSFTVAVSKVGLKNSLFDYEERYALLQEAVQDLKLSNVDIQSFDGLLINYCEKNDFRVIIRGLRAISDFEYEFQMALTNKKIREEIETIFMMSKETYSYLSSSLIKEIVALGGPVTAFVPLFVEEALKKKLGGA